MTPVITKTEHTVLSTLISNLPYNEKTKDVALLVNELEKAEIVNDEEIGSDVIRLNSYFEIEESVSKRIMRFLLTMPKQANMEEKKISVLSPLGVALFGFRQGMEIEWVLPGGLKKLKILKVTNTQSS